MTTTDTCTPDQMSGHNRLSTEFLSARHLETHGGFALPYLAPGMDVLDCGSGPGTITLGLADVAFPGRVTGLDSNPRHVQTGSRLAEGLEMVNASFCTGSVYEIPFKQGSFDMVFAHALVEHLNDPSSAMREMQRVLRPGGFVALCSPDWDHFSMSPAPHDAEDAIDAYRELQHRNGGDTRAGARLEQHLRASGFEILEGNTRFNVYPDTTKAAEYLALQLEHTGETTHAAALRNWARLPGSLLVGAWTHCIARKPVTD